MIYKLQLVCRMAAFINISINIGLNGNPLGMFINFGWWLKRKVIPFENATPNPSFCLIQHRVLYLEKSISHLSTSSHNLVGAPNALSFQMIPWLFQTHTKNVKNEGIPRAVRVSYRTGLRSAPAEPLSWLNLFSFRTSDWAKRLGDDKLRQAPSQRSASYVIRVEAVSEQQASPWRQVIYLLNFHRGDLPGRWGGGS